MKQRCQGGPSKRIRQHGITLVELMISMVLALVLIGGVMQVLTTSQTSYTQLVQQARLQESAKLAMDYLVRDIRMVGYWGCNGNNINIANSVDTDEDSYFNPNDALKGYDVGTSTMPADVSGDDTIYDGVVSGTDIVEMRLLSIDGSYTVESHNPSSAVIHLTEDFTGSEGDILAMVDSNCSNVGIFAVTPGGGGPGDPDKVNHNTGVGIDVSNCTKNLRGEFDCDNEAGSVGGAYPPGSSVYSVRYVSFGIKPSAFGDNVNALWQLVPNGNDIELVEGIDNIQIVYGLDTTGNGVVNRFATAKNIEDSADLNFEQAVVLRIDVTSRSLESVSDIGVLTDDFSTSIRLRNRGI